MNNTVACFKWVIDDEKIVVRDDLSIDYSKAGGKISELDLAALHIASLSAKSLGGKSYALTFGDTGLSPSIKDALSRGMDEIYYVADDVQKTVDGAFTAKVLAEAVRQIPEVGLVFCAEGASDTFARQIGPRLAANLGWPVVTSVAKYEVKEDKIIAERKLDQMMETVEVPFPAVICVLSQATTVPIPGLRAIMQAGKKPQNELSLSGLGFTGENLCRKTEIVEDKGYVMNRKNVIFKDGDNQELVDAFLDSLVKEGVL